jgi:4'-phosphopantetheinyl transferase
MQEMFRNGRTASRDMSDGWRRPCGALALPADEVHVWLASLDSAEKADLARFEGILGAEEHARAARYRFPRDRERFVVRRGILRQVLAGYVDDDPGALRFTSSAHGKPALERNGDSELPAFNLSDSHGLALYAIARHRTLGVDLERVDPTSSRGEIAERFFSRREAETLRVLPKETQPWAFFACWTRKEAYLKARGEGLSLPLHQFEVSVAPDEPAVLLSTAQGSAETCRWSLNELPPIPGYAAALCVEGHDWQLRCWRWPPLPPTTGHGL